MGSDGERRDYYARLEVASGASHDDIVGAYRRLAMGAHPDAHPDDPEAAGRFREITEAYEVLGDPERRDAYDRQLKGSRIHVRVRTVSNGDGGGAGADVWPHHKDEPVFLSPRRPRPGDVALGVWPVWDRRLQGLGAEPSSAERWLWEASDRFGRIAESWWDS